MSDYTVKRISDMEATHGGGFIKARAELGVTSFGFQVIELPPRFDGYPEHDHGSDGQEEVYVVLSGRATMVVGGDEIALDRETMVRVASSTTRKIVTGDGGVRLLVMGGVPGSSYVPSPGTELATPA